MHYLSDSIRLIALLDNLAECTLVGFMDWNNMGNVNPRTYEGVVYDSKEHNRIPLDICHDENHHDIMLYN